MFIMLVASIVIFLSVLDIASLSITVYSCFFILFFFDYIANIGIVFYIRKPFSHFNITLTYSAADDGSRSSSVVELTTARRLSGETDPPAASQRSASGIEEESPERRRSEDLKRKVRPDAQIILDVAVRAFFCI
jgi:hypothetical protein